MNYYGIDAFTSKPFSGNPAAVVLVTKHLEEKRIQEIAAEINLPNTAFLWPIEKLEDPWKNCRHFKLRWFTPIKETNLCGHATLASAHSLFKEIGNQSDSIQFETLSGPLIVARERDSIRLDFPSLPGKELTPEEEDEFKPLISAVVGGHTVLSKVYEPKTNNLIIRITSDITRKQFANIQPNFDALNNYVGSNIKGIVLTTKGDFDEEEKRGFEGCHVASRYFAPWYGVPEDFATGSTHTILAPYWSEELGIRKLKCIQCSRRTGMITVATREDNRVDLIGNSVTICCGNIRV